VSANKVGFDGSSYFCLRCGQAGFQTRAAAIGHLAQCGKPVQVYQLPATDAAGGGAGGGGGGAGGGGGGGGPLLVYLEDLDARLSRLEHQVRNQVQHLQAVAAHESGTGWLPWVIIGIFLLFVLSSPKTQQALRSALSVGKDVRGLLG
jgi:hypothetical protein